LILAPLFATYKNYYEEIASFGNQSKPYGMSLINFSGLEDMLPIVVFAAVYHQSIPSLADESTDKKNISLIFGITLALSGVFYSIIGSINAWYFGHLVEASINLNFANFHGNLISKMISLFVLLFPATTVVSGYPLNAIVLTNSIIGIIHGKKAREVEEDTRLKNIVTTLASIPPLFGALFVSDLGVILGYTGLTGLMMAFCFPAMLNIASEIKCKKLGISVKTAYDHIGSSIHMATIIFLFGLFSFIYIFVNLTIKNLKSVS